MLVLARRAGESLQIGPNVRITVTHISGSRVKIGIDAPRDVNVRRSELPEQGLRKSLCRLESAGRTKAQ